MIISWQALTCDSAHSWRLYSVASLAGQAHGTMNRYRSHYHDAELTDWATEFGGVYVYMFIYTI